MSPGELREAAGRLTERSRAAQGLSPTIDDPTTLATVAALLVAANGKSAPKGARTDSLVMTATPTPEGGRHG